MRKASCIIIFLFVAGLFLPGYMYAAEKPIVIGAPLATAFLYGWDAERGIKLAAEEINAAGGVKVGAVKEAACSRGHRYAGPRTGGSRQRGASRA